MPRIRSAQMTSNHRITGAWCPGCGLYAHCNDGRHRGDCTRGHHGHTAGEACTTRCFIPTVNNPCAQHAGPDTPGGPNP